MFFKKRKEDEQMTTYEEVKAAYEKLSEEDKGKFKQSLKDRIDESVGEEKDLHGDKTKQPVKDDIKESVGEEKELAEKREEKAEGEAMPKAEMGEEKAGDWHEALEGIKQEIASLRAEMTAAKQEPKAASEEKQSMLDKIAALYRD